MGLDVNNEIKTYIYIRREGNPRGIPIDFRWITIHLSRFRSFSQSVARVPGMRTQVPESNKRSERPRTKDKMLRGEVVSI
ncbi:hypothetical protein HanRHA438_Chr08g0357301 [Helianthus annuus]|uniref:Uncharacterized protein n=1 Tax=Helianthus annuus TaxID=4232 RepID=A0A9K3DFP7_HELAN|nr:hypothetical protein HanXRQr2_MTg0834531 [Helianthus annuus]KAJ0898479.1 hypothetical protein HanRHA438_Chr08g0357301 [Helianthus annuus]